jgi:flagellar hook-associated protein 2
MEVSGMIQAYNYLLASFPVKREVLYPAKNRGELKRVYDNIVSLSKSSPYYKINISQENQEYAIGIKEAALTLKGKLMNMQESDDAGFQSKTVSISDESVLTAKLINENTETLPDTIKIKVNGLADVQINKGKELLNTSFAFPEGEYELDVKVADENYSLKFVQEHKMSNQDTLTRLADYLNKSLPGINAAVEKGRNQEYSRLTIASDMSGRFGDRSFSFSDDVIYGEGIVDFFGLNRVEKEASYSDFELNGARKQTATNTFNLENALQISLNRKDDDTVTLKIVPDSNQILSSVDSVLTTYNNLMKLAKNRVDNNKGEYSASKLITELKSLEKVYRDELEASGIKAGDDGELSLEDALAVQASEDGGMESLFTRKNGFISRLIEKAQAIAINPMEYMEKTVVTYPNNEKTSFSNVYVTSMYSGMLFSSYC